MPQSSPKVCAHSNCQKATAEKYCPEHKTTQRQEWAAYDKDRASASERGYDVRWQEYRQLYLRHNPLCVLCLKQGKHTQASVVDHINPHKGNMVLFWDSNNHQSLCRSCHDTKTRQEINKRKSKCD